MVNIKRFLIENANLETKVEKSEYGKTIFTQKTIKCRKESIRNLTFFSKGEDILSGSVYYTSEPVSVGDKVDGNKVVKVVELKDMRGVTIVFEVYVS